MEAIPLAETGNPPARSALKAETRPFDFYADTFAFPNELVWEYRFDNVTGQGTAQKRNPPPTYAHHCFVVVRSVRQFFLHSTFEPQRPSAEASEYQSLIRAVVSRHAQRASSPTEKIRIPGFANLRCFSEAHPDLLRENCGGSWQSYIQRGNWRMVLPFWRAHQQRRAAQWRHGISQLPIVHVVTFPRLTINHAVMLFAATTTNQGTEFQAYDPNICAQPLTLVYDAARRCFEFSRTNYFAGGRVNAYEIYSGWFY
jgi:hypothetical protein